MTGPVTADGAPPESPTVVRRLETSSATSLARLVDVFEDLQMVLRCCERLMTALDEGLNQPSPDSSTPQSLGLGPSVG